MLNTNYKKIDEPIRKPSTTKIRSTQKPNPAGSSRHPQTRNSDRSTISSEARQASRPGTSARLLDGFQRSFGGFNTVRGGNGPTQIPSGAPTPPAGDDPGRVLSPHGTIMG